LGCVGSAEHAQKLSTPIEDRVPGSELLEALLVVTSPLNIFIGAAYAACAEAADGTGGRDQGWDSIEGV
jgi:hypothetical protein